MIIDRKGKMFEDRRKEDIKVKKERRKESNKIVKTKAKTIK